MTDHAPDPAPPPARPTSPAPPPPADEPSSLGALLALTFLGSFSGGAFWSGLFFVTAGQYRFSPERNLVLAACLGAVSVAGSLVAARLARHLAPRPLLRAALCCWSAVAVLPMVFPDSESLLWISALAGVGFGALLWPVVESYLTAGRHGAPMRRALGTFNITWTAATALPLFLLPLLGREHLAFSLACAAITNVTALLAVRGLPPHPAPHSREAAASATGAEYRWMARSASWLLPASYVISAALSPILPHRIDSVMGASVAAGPIAAVWMVARFGVLLAMWRSPLWHGRWVTLAIAGLALLGGLALVLLAGAPAVLIAGLALFGTGMGITYYAAVYYAMTVGHAAVDAGGQFEALIGLGYVLGPGLGVLAYAIADDPRVGSATVLLIWCAAALASPGAILPYLRARASRATSPPRRG